MARPVDLSEPSCTKLLHTLIQTAIPPAKDTVGPLTSLAMEAPSLSPEVPTPKDPVGSLAVREAPSMEAVKCILRFLL